MADRSRQLHCHLKLRVSEVERRAFMAAAEVSGLSMSAWARMVLRERVGVAGIEAAKAVPFEGRGIVR